MSKRVSSPSLQPDLKFSHTALGNQTDTDGLSLRSPGLVSGKYPSKEWAQQTGAICFLVTADWTRHGQLTHSTPNKILLSPPPSITIYWTIIYLNGHIQLLLSLSLSSLSLSHTHTQLILMSASIWSKANQQIWKQFVIRYMWVSCDLSGPRALLHPGNPLTSIFAHIPLLFYCCFITKSCLPVLWPQGL